MANNALQFNGSTQYVNIGVVGNFGSNFGSGVYVEFDIQTTAAETTFQSIIGALNTGTTMMLGVDLNSNGTGSEQNSTCRIFIRDNTGLGLGAATTNAFTWNDGKPHHFVMIATPSNNTVQIIIDGVVQAITYFQQQSPVTWVNFANALVFGARNVRGTIGAFYNGILDNLKIGTDVNHIYAYYKMDEGSGTTTTDSSGKGNTGTLNATPTWVSGLLSWPNYYGTKRILQAINRAGSF